VHFVGIRGALRNDRREPALGLGEGPIAIEAGGGEAAQISLDVVGDLSRETAPVREPAGMRRRRS